MEKELVREQVDTLDHSRLEIKSIVAQAVRRQLPVAVWRKPLSDRVSLALSLSKDTVVGDFELENLGSGFLFCPFMQAEKFQNHLINDDILIHFSKDKSPELDLKNKINEQLVNDLFSANNEDTHPIPFYRNDGIGPASCETPEEFEKMVNRAIAEIGNGMMRKVVPARCSSIDLPAHFSAIDFFRRLEASYPNAFIYLVAIPGAGTWIGATPENLIAVDGDGLFKTTALAGTQKYEEGMNLADAAWRQKEIEEQALVSRYIIDCFKKIRLREFEEVGPKTVKAGNLIHLKTDFIVNMNEVNYPMLPTVMLSLLHPTSAVCGMPREAAIKFIQEHEHFDRGYFSGYLGPVNIEGNTDLFVNLRCMQLVKEEKALVYAGAGVTIDSQAQKEWQETELKMDTLLKKLNGI